MICFLYCCNLKAAATRIRIAAGLSGWRWRSGVRAALIGEYYERNSLKYIYYAFPYLMRPALPTPSCSPNADEYLLELQSKLALKQAQQTSGQCCPQEIDYDSLFAQEAGPAEFNQLLSHSLSHHHNFSEIDERYYEEDSLFNDRDADYLRPPPHHRHASNNSTKILQILQQKDGRAKETAERSTNGSLRDSASKNRNSSKSLVLKPMIPRKNQSASTSSHSMKLAGQEAGKRVRTECNEDAHSLDQRFSQMCKTEYDNKEEFAKNLYSTILEEKDSLECTFKPTLLKDSLQENRDRPAGRTSGALKEQKNCKNSKLSSISHSLKLKNSEKERKSLELQKERPVLSKKPSGQASGSTLDVATRNQLWLLQKEQRLNVRRREEEEQKSKKEDFSFKPNINLYKNARPKAAQKEAVPPFFERLSMAKRKSTAIQFRREGEQPEKNKENLVGLVNEGCLGRGKRQSYEEAVKQLHSKIMKMNL